MAIRNLVGDKIGKLLVLEKILPKSAGNDRTAWKCQCDCGKMAVVLDTNLARKNTGTKSCGCIVKHVSFEIGQKLEKLTIIERIPPRTFGNKDSYWKCQCDCGNVVNIIQSSLRKKNPQKSCGCINIIKLITGQRFGRLVVLQPIYEIDPITKLQSKKWECKCDCGKIVKKTARHLQYGTVSCGCFTSDRMKKLMKDRTKYDLKTRTARKVYCALYSDGDLSFEDFYKLSQQNCFYCNSPPVSICHSKEAHSRAIIPNSEFKYNGLDRVDSSIKAHNLDNCVTCCIDCNFAKNRFPTQTFLNQISKIYSDGDHKFFQNYPNKREIIEIMIEHGFFKGKDLKKTRKGFALNRIYLAYKRRSLQRFKEFTLTLFQFYWMVSDKCSYCGCVPANYKNYNDKKQRKTLFYNGLDRANNSLGYSIENCITSCRTCNFFKRKRNHEEFISWAEQIYKHSILGK